MSLRPHRLHPFILSALVGSGAPSLFAQAPAPPAAVPPGAADPSAPPTAPAPAPAPVAAPAPAAPPPVTTAPGPEPLATPPAEPAPASIDLGVPPLDAAVAAPPQKKPEPGRFEIASEDGAHKLEFHATLHADARLFLTDKGGVSSFLMRRVRPALDGKVFRYYEFRIQPDFAGTRVQILDAYANLHFWDAIQFRAGKGKGPVGLERLQSPTAMLFAERAFPSQLAPNRDVGAQLHGKLAEGTLEWAVGVYNGVPNGQSGDLDLNDSKDLEARVFLLPFASLGIDALSGLGVGFAATYGNQFGAPSGYVTPGQQAFFAYASNVSAFGERTLLAPQAYYYGGPLSLMFELTKVRDHLKNTTGAEGTVGTLAWQLAGSVVAGGKPSYKGVKVKNPVDPATGGFGAVELAARYHDLRVGDLAFERGFSNINTSAQRASAWAVGATWHFANGYKLVVDYESTTFRGGSRDGDRPAELLLLNRLQAAF